MLKEIELYYFSPTGGTRKIGEIFAEAMAEKVKLTDLGETKAPVETPECEVVVAAPVFGGRIPAIVSERLGAVRGDGKKAVTLAVYGNRAYEDALLELNDVMEASGFQVIASGSFVAQHSIVPKVGAGRPDEKDMEELREFAEKVLDKLEAGEGGRVQVPGNRPYKQGMQVSATPISTDSCVLCGKCETACPTNAVCITNGAVQTQLEKCMLCMACTAVCPEHARILPEPLQEGTNQKLAPLLDVRNGNEVFLL